MAAIDDYIQKIRYAVYGREIREAIANGIQQCYNDGKAGIEDQIARNQANAADTKAKAAYNHVKSINNNKLTNAYLFRSVTKSVTIAKGKYLTDNITWKFDLPKGYKIVALMGWTTGSSQVYFPRLQRSGVNTVSGALGTWTAANAKTCKTTINVLAMRDSLNIDKIS